MMDEAGIIPCVSGWEIEDDLKDHYVGYPRVLVRLSRGHCPIIAA